MRFERFCQRLRAVARYRRWPLLFFYADGKTALDPAYPAAAEALENSRLPLLDLGCGMGLLAAYLRARGYEAPILGLDADEKKIRIAQEALAGTGVHFLAGDARGFPEHQGNVVMLDVLHYFDDAAQDALLRRIAASVAPGGMALLRISLNEPTWRFAMTRAEEWLIPYFRWIPWSGSNFPLRDEVCTPFREAGFAEEIRPMWGWTPFNGYFFLFRRPGSVQAEVDFPAVRGSRAKPLQVVENAP